MPVNGFEAVVELGKLLHNETIGEAIKRSSRRKKDLGLPVKAVELLQSGQEMDDRSRLDTWFDFEKFPITEDAAIFGQRIAERVLVGGAAAKLTSSDEELVAYLMDEGLLNVTGGVATGQDAELRRRSRIIGSLRVAEAYLRTKGVAETESFSRTLGFFDRANMPKIEEGNISDRAAWLQACVFGYAEAWNHPQEGIIDDESPLYARTRQLVQSFSNLESTGYKQQITVAKRMGFGVREATGFDKFSDLHVSGRFIMQDVQSVQGVENGYDAYHAVVQSFR